MTTETKKQSWTNISLSWQYPIEELKKNPQKHLFSLYVELSVYLWNDIYVKGGKRTPVKESERVD